MLDNKFSCLSETDTENVQQLESLKKIGKKGRTEDQNILYNNLMKEKRREKNKQSMATRRKKTIHRRETCGKQKRQREKGN